MFQRIIPFAIFYLFACSLTGQNLQKVPFDVNNLRALSSSRAPCSLNDVGDDIIISSQPTNQTNSNFGIGETIYLCFNDSIGIAGIGANAVFGGDPDPATQPGVGFAVYDCPPTVDGDNLATFLGDNCLFGDPMDEQAVTVSIDFDEPFGGNTIFRNSIQPGIDTTFQGLLNNGNPFQWWFTPITFDALDGVNADWELDPVTGEEGPCISLDTAQTFSVVYLNAIEVFNENFPFGGNACEARLSIRGGLPEFDINEEYTIQAVNRASPAITAEVSRVGPANQPFLTLIKAPVAGIYDITISDGKSCELFYSINMGDCDTNKEVTIESTNNAVNVDGIVCTDITVENFDSILSAQFVVVWDTNFLEILPSPDGVTNILDGGDWRAAVSNNPNNVGRLPVSFLSNDFNNGDTRPDGTILFSICFRALQEGAAQILLTDNASFPLADEFTDKDGNQINTVNKNEGTITILDPEQVTAFIADDGVKDACPMMDNGNIEISAFGGIGPYEISISGGNLPFPEGPAPAAEGEVVTFSDLAAGKYEYFIQDNTTPVQRFTRDSFEILEADLDVSIRETTSISCNGSSDGVLQAQVAIGGNLVSDLSDYTFKWVNNADDTISTNDSAINLPQGAYTVFAESNNGCADFGRTSLFEPMPISFTPNVDPPSCSGVADGSVELANVAGGTAPYNVLWSDGATDLNNTGIASDTFGFVITDNLGCELVDTVIVEAEVELVINVVQDFPKDASCFGFSDGEIDITATQDVNPGGTPANGNYTFAWSPNVTNIDNSVIQSSIVDSLAAGSYSVTLTNSGLPAGCQAVQDFIISEPDTLIVDRVDITNVSSCSLTNPDGAIEVTFIGGTPNYVYEWTDTADMNVGNTAELTGQPSGLLSLTVTDANGCETMIDTAIGTPPPPEIQFFEGTDLDCATDTYPLTVTARPGNRPGITQVLTYQWEHDASITGPNATVGPDTFMVTVIDSDGCASAATAIVTAPPAIRTTEVTFKPACFATEDGEISVNVTGGNNIAGQAYDFTWSLNNNELSTSSQLLNAAPESYTLNVMDATGCPFDTTIVLGSLPRIVVDFPTADISGVACFDTPTNQCNGEAVANANYEGTGGGVFTFTWGATGETIGMTNTFNSSSLCAGFQQISVIDTSGCEMIDSVMIPSPDEILLVTDALEDVSCFGAGDGSVNIDATGGNGGFTFAWSDGSTDQMRADLVAGDYDIVILDRDGCTGQDNITINEPEELVVSIDDTQTNNVICEGDANGRITVMVTGGNPGLNYTWTNNVSAIESAAGLAPGTYLIDVVDSKNCMGQANYTVLEPTPITAQVDWDPIQCNGFQTGIRLMNVAGGNPGDYTFSVDDSPARPIDETITEFGGDRKISIFDAEGCRVDSIYNIEQPRPLEATFVENLVEVDLGSSIELDLEINGDLPIAEIIWAQGGEQPDSSFMCAFLPCDNPTVNPLDNTVYTATVFDANDCMTEASITVNVDKNRNVYIPNVFAPNNAGFDTNDRFSVFTGSGVSKINYARVFNRWGTMVADLTEKRISGAGETTEIWDGFIKGEKANQGVYIYIVEIEFIDNTTLLYRGDVALLR